MQNIEDVPYSTCVHESDVSSNIHIHIGLGDTDI